MKKLNCAIALIFLLSLLCTGCQNVNKSNETVTSSNNNLNNKSDTLSSNELLEDTNMKKSDALDKYIENFNDRLIEKGLKLEGKAKKDGSAIGATAGYGFNINNSPVELYIFDHVSKDMKTTENLKTAKESGYITIFGTEINGKTPKPTCVFHENMVLIFPMEDYGIKHPNKEQVIDSFMNAS